MLSKTDAYKAAITGDARRLYIEIIANLIDPDIVYGTAAAQSESNYSKSADLHDYNYSPGVKYATLEQDRWALDGTCEIYPDNLADITSEMGYMSAALSGADGTFSTAQYVEMQFSGVDVLQACSVFFPDNDYDGIPENFTIDVYQGGTVYATETVTGNTEASYSFEGFTVYNPDAIRVTVTKMSRPYRRMRCVEIVPGIYERWDDDVVSSLSIKQQIDVTCTSLPYGTCTFTLDNQSGRFDPRNKSGVFETISEHKDIPIKLGVLLPDGTVDYTNTGVYFQRSTGWKLADNGLSITWDMVDIIGLISGRAYIVPATLPTTLTGWVSSIMSQLGTDFANWYTIDTDYASTAITAASADALKNMSCGDVLRYVCMAAGCFPRADSQTGYLAIDPIWSAGNKLTLDNMEDYPEMGANKDLALITFTLSDGTTYTVNGTDTSSDETVSIKNPFIHTAAAALAVANNLLTYYGGNTITITGRGDMSSECGDVDVVQVDENTAVSARRSSQEFAFSGGTMQGVRSTLIQPSGAYLANTRVVITQSGTWTAPSGVTQLNVILVGPGQDGGDGTDGSYTAAGVDGAAGLGGYVWAGTVNANEQQSFAVTIDGTQTAFGAYSAANGNRYNGYTDIRSGAVYARDGIDAPIANSGDGGKAGVGGVKGSTGTYLYYYDENNNKVIYNGLVIYIDKWVMNFYGEMEYKAVQTYPEQMIFTGFDTPITPGTGTEGTPGATGCVVIWYATPEGG